MKRTKQRALVTGDISIEDAFIYATILGILGLGVLAEFTNLVTVSVGILGLIFYVIVYGYAKRKTVHGTLVGSISGALPPVAGYLAVSGQVDSAALILFIILVCWQMPHFYAISLYRLKEYKNAGLPVLPIVHGTHNTKIQILAYIVAFIAASYSLYAYGYTNIWYLLVALILGGVWLYFGLKGFKNTNVNTWAKMMFRLSLIVLTVLCIAISLSGFFA